MCQTFRAFIRQSIRPMVSLRRSFEQASWPHSNSHSCKKNSYSFFSDFSRKYRVLNPAVMKLLARFLICFAFASLCLNHVNKVNADFAGFLVDFSKDSIKLRLNDDKPITPIAEFHSNNLLDNDEQHYGRLIDETLYSASRYGKNHRFLFTIGAREDGTFVG